ncbi:MAG: DNA polymerase III subunit delta' [Candidatus Zhuqueibacterota bacterium]
MSFENIIGQKRVIAILEKAIRSKRLPHALLFHGPEGVGKEAIALELAKALFCQQDVLYCDACRDCMRVKQWSHPDLVILYPAPKQPTPDEVQTIRKSLIDNPYVRAHLWANPSILIDTIRGLKKMSAMTSYENKGRVVIVMDAHKMTTEAANSLLKILEEPPGNMTIILVSSQPNLLLPTIVSRCQKVRFDPIPCEDIEAALISRESIPAERAAIVARMSFGSYRRSLELLDEDLNEKQELVVDVLRKLLVSDLEVVMTVEDLVQKEDKKTIKELMGFMMIWFRDAMAFDVLTPEDHANGGILNYDRLDVLRKFVGNLEPINFQQVISSIEKAIELIDRNVYLNVVLLQLFFKLKENLRRKIDVR